MKVLRPVVPQRTQARPVTADGLPTIPISVSRLHAPGHSTEPSRHDDYAAGTSTCPLEGVEDKSQGNITRRGPVPKQDAMSLIGWVVVVIMGAAWWRNWNESARKAWRAAGEAQDAARECAKDLRFSERRLEEAQRIEQRLLIANEAIRANCVEREQAVDAWAGFADSQLAKTVARVAKLEEEIGIGREKLVEVQEKWHRTLAELDNVKDEHTAVALRGKEELESARKVECALVEERDQLHDQLLRVRAQLEKVIQKHARAAVSARQQTTAAVEEAEVTAFKYMAEVLAEKLAPIREELEEERRQRAWAFRAVERLKESVRLAQRACDERDEAMRLLRETEHLRPADGHARPSVAATQRQSSADAAT